MKKSTFRPTSEQVTILQTLRDKKPQKYRQVLQWICKVLDSSCCESGLWTAIKRQKSPECFVSADAVVDDETGEFTLEIRETRMYTVPLSSVQLSDDALEEIAEIVSAGMQPREYTKGGSRHWSLGLRDVAARKMKQTAQKKTL